MSPTEKVRYKNMADFGFGPIVMKKTRVCKNCGHMVEGRSANCPECGEKLPKETLFDHYKKKHRSCSACDTVLTADWQYCPKCGKQILQKAAGCQEKTPKGGRKNEK